MDNDINLNVNLGGSVSEDLKAAIDDLNKKLRYSKKELKETTHTQEVSKTFKEYEFNAQLTKKFVQFQKNLFTQFASSLKLGFLNPFISTAFDALQSNLQVHTRKEKQKIVSKFSAVDALTAGASATSAGLNYKQKQNLKKTNQQLQQLIEETQNAHLKLYEEIIKRSTPHIKHKIPRVGKATKDLAEELASFGLPSGRWRDPKGKLLPDKTINALAKAGKLLYETQQGPDILKNLKLDKFVETLKQTNSFNKIHNQLLKNIPVERIASDLGVRKDLAPNFKKLLGNIKQLGDVYNLHKDSFKPLTSFELFTKQVSKKGSLSKLLLNEASKLQDDTLYDKFAKDTALKLFKNKTITGSIKSIYKNIQKFRDVLIDQELKAYAEFYGPDSKQFQDRAAAWGKFKKPLVDNLKNTIDEALKEGDANNVPKPSKTSAFSFISLLSKLKSPVGVAVGTVAIASMAPIVISRIGHGIYEGLRKWHRELASISPTLGGVAQHSETMRRLTAAYGSSSFLIGDALYEMERRPIRRDTAERFDRNWFVNTWTGGMRGLSQNWENLSNLFSRIGSTGERSPNQVFQNLVTQEQARRATTYSASPLNFFGINPIAPYVDRSSIEASVRQRLRNNPQQLMELLSAPQFQSQVLTPEQYHMGQQLALMQAPAQQTQMQESARLMEQHISDIMELLREGNNTNRRLLEWMQNPVGP